MANTPKRKLKPITCARCKRGYYEPQIRACPHPAILKNLGTHICYYCCRQCKHHTKHPLCGAIGCDYKP